MTTPPMRNTKMPSPQDQQKLIEGGAGFIGDLARQSGGNVQLTNEDIKNSGAGFWGDMARQGGQVVSP